MQQHLLTARDDYDEVVIDAGGFDSQELRAAMLVADVILVPLRVGSNANIEGFRDTSDLIAEIIKARTTVPRVLGVKTVTGSNWTAVQVKSVPKRL